MAALRVGLATVSAWKGSAPETPGLTKTSGRRVFALGGPSPRADPTNFASPDLPFQVGEIGRASSAECALLPFPDQHFSISVPPLRASRSTRKRSNLDRTLRRLLAALEDPSRVLFLDIETTGLSRYYDQVTLVGWLVDGVYRVFLAGDDPKPLLTSLREASALVTFNGTLFDLRFLEKTFACLVSPSVHADLRYLAKRLGLIGGQKAIEKQLGLSIRGGVEDIDGPEAVLLWHRYLRGDTQSLRRLIEYNRCDVLGMRGILDYVLRRLIADPTFWLRETNFSLHSYVVSGWATPEMELPSPKRLRRRENTFRSLLSGTPADKATVVGIDLTSSGSKPSGWCVLRGSLAETGLVGSDEEIITRILSTAPALVSIDSPLSIPYGRSRVEDDDPARFEYGIMRRCERELKRRGINVYPCLLPSMQGLTRRGMNLAARLRAFGIPVIESYPGAAQDIMGIPRKRAGIEFLGRGLADFGVKGRFCAEPVSHDELDAITSAVVGAFFLAGKYEALGGDAEDPLIIPDVHAAPGPLVVGISGRICAGKTTTARLFEGTGFAYTRFSQVVDEEILAQGELLSREARQRIGLEINRTKGQRWLCERVLSRVRDQSLIVIDGLRFRQDHAFLTERFGMRFVHVHIVARADLRRARYDHDHPSDVSFDQADADPVENEVDDLIKLAGVSVDNSATISDLRTVVSGIVGTLTRNGGVSCRSQ